MRIAMGADHAGYELKNKIREYLVKKGFEVQDEGTNSDDSVDYPDFAAKVGSDVASQKADRGILVCGSGIGMAIAANKVHGVRSANISSEYEAQMSREHNDLNVLTLGARILDEAKAFSIVDVWLKTQFAGDRHQRRVQKMMAIEEQS
jgi:ribose 5-phosphate isomerase B